MASVSVNGDRAGGRRALSCSLSLALSFFPSNCAFFHSLPFLWVLLCFIFFFYLSLSLSKHDSSSDATVLPSPPFISLFIILYFCSPDQLWLRCFFPQVHPEASAVMLSCCDSRLCIHHPPRPNSSHAQIGQ